MSSEFKDRIAGAISEQTKKADEHNGECKKRIDLAIKLLDAIGVPDILQSLKDSHLHDWKLDTSGLMRTTVGSGGEYKGVSAAGYELYNEDLMKVIFVGFVGDTKNNACWGDYSLFSSFGIAYSSSSLNGCSSDAPSDRQIRTARAGFECHKRIANGKAFNRDFYGDGKTYDITAEIIYGGGIDFLSDDEFAWTRLGSGNTGIFMTTMEKLFGDPEFLKKARNIAEDGIIKIIKLGANFSLLYERSSLRKITDMPHWSLWRENQRTFENNFGVIPSGYLLRKYKQEDREDEMIFPPQTQPYNPGWTPMRPLPPTDPPIIGG